MIAWRIYEVQRFIDQTCEIQTGTDAADGARQHIIKHKRGDGKLRQRPPESFVHNTVHASANEHAAAFDINCAHGIGKKHDTQNEPWRRFSDKPFGKTAGVVGGRRQSRRVRWQTLSKTK